MAFRTETTAGARFALIVIIVAGPLFGQDGNWQVRHRHLHGGAMGSLRITEKSVSFTGAAKKEAAHSQTWNYDDIQQLVLSPDKLRIVTYENRRWPPVGERVYEFDRLPAALAHDTYPMFIRRLDQRFVAALADDQVQPNWQVPAKLASSRKGPEGVLLFTSDKVVFKTNQPDASRSWRITDIENVSSSDRFELVVNTHERDFRFLLKKALDEDRFEHLWRQINRSHGLQILSFNDVTGEYQ
jgi:hypothetical protein